MSTPGQNHGLCLSRETGEAFKITLPDGRLCEVRLMSIPRRNKARIFLSFPLDVTIEREEIYQDRMKAAAAAEVKSV